ncbi:MAG: teichuronic acid biosynthesis protein TuaE, putative secreted polysaccharide polymerase [Sphingobacteriales bacterium]|nr:teichuronic acid biosynthesis protein TuaE, putative secreted polysaccharide polymerase [Sphingobacteriales bacterium]
MKSLKNWMRNIFVIEKLHNPFGVALLGVLCVVFTFLIAKGGLAAGIMILIATLAIPAVYALVVYPKIGIIALMVASYLIMWLIRMRFAGDFPLGTTIDGLQILLILGFFIKQKSNPDWSYLRNPISAMILIWIGYNMLQLVNPTAESPLAWLYTIRTVAVVMLMYFVFMYHIKTIEFIRLIVKTWIGLSLFAAIYGFKQQYFGFFGFEEELLSDPLTIALLFIGGVWRKFSIFSDPVAFSYNMVISALLCLGLITGPISKAKKILLGIFAIFFLMNMLYSGTRGAYVLVPVSLILFSILKFNKQIMILGSVGAVLFISLIFIPTSNNTLYRFQSAFKPSDDASFNVRTINQKRIQPYILSHPLGGGLGATGVWGKRFAPTSYLANFPPDSGYVRVAVELGWVGLLIFCILMFVILKTGVDNYFKIKDPELKSYCLAMTLIAFTLNFGNYPQEAFVQFPVSIYFYLVIAIINVCLILDQKKQSVET